MATQTDLIATLTSGSYKAEVYGCDLPGEFVVHFVDAEGNVLESSNMTGVSTYRQREKEIMERLQTFASGETPADPADLSASGEY